MLKKIGYVLIASMLLFSCTGGDKTDKEGPLEEAAEKADDQLEKAGEKIEEGMDKAGEKIDDAGEKIKDALDGDKKEEHGDSH
jgi:peptidoglycan hydrolase CwlO-like protein